MGNLRATIVSNTLKTSPAFFKIHWFQFWFRFRFWILDFPYTHFKQLTILNKDLNTHINFDSLHLSSPGLNKAYNQTLARLIPEPVTLEADDSQTKPVYCNKKSQYTTGVIMTL